MARKIKYSDVDLDFLKHPNTGDISKLVNVSAVKRAIRNLVLTAYYDAPWQPQKGNFIANALFENDTLFTRDRIQTEITQMINLWEPRVTNLLVEVFNRDHEYVVNISFEIVGLYEPVNFDITLKNVR